MKKHYLLDSKLYYFFLHIILFFYVYSIQFIGIPFNLGTRVFMGIIGFLIFIYEIIGSKKSFVFSKHFFKIYLALFLISIISFFSLLYNGTNQLDFLSKYQVSIIIIIFASYFVTKMVSLRTTFENQVPKMMQLFINVVLIQIILSILMFAVQPLRDILNGIQVTSDHELEVLEATMEFRLVGFGSKFFGSGIINGFALILIGAILKYSSHIKINVFKYSIYFLFIFIFGMMMARTTIVGALLSFGIIFWPRSIIKINFNQINKNFKFLFYLISIPIIIVLLLFYFFPRAKESVELAFNFGFEMFVNYFQANSLESESTNAMKDMYVWPTSIKTYLIGDGLYTDVISDSYYMGTDIGILRLIYYFGLGGLFSYLLFQYYTVKAAYLRNPRYKYLFMVFFIYCIILNYKGFTDLFFLNILFFNNNYQDKITNEKDVIYYSISSK